MSRPQVEEVSRGEEEGCDLQMMGLSPVGGRPLQSSPGGGPGPISRTFPLCSLLHSPAGRQHSQCMQEMARRYSVKHFYYDVIIMVDNNQSSWKFSCLIYPVNIQEFQNLQYVIGWLVNGK